MKKQEEIAERIYEIYKDISEYDDPQFHYNVFVEPDGTTWRGDLHINSQSWSQSNVETIYEFSLYPIFTTQNFLDEGYSLDDTETMNEWKHEANGAMIQYADEMAEAIVNGLPIDEIQATMFQ